MSQPPLSRLGRRLFLGLRHVLLLMGWLAGTPALAQEGRGGQGGPLLECALTYAGATQLLQARPTTDPYGVASVDVGGRFWFKAVLVGEGNRLDYVSLYAYLDTARQPLLIQQAKYRPPFVGPQRHDLTGQQHLYAGALERELIYQCSLQGVQP